MAAGVFDTPEARRNYILGEAAKRGIDPNLVDRLVRSEGGYSGYDMTGDHGQSFGPFQDYIGGGLGNQMIAQGIDPRNPANERAGIDWNLDYIQQHGASPDVWHGLRRGGDLKPGEARWTGGAGQFEGGGPLYLGTVEKMAGVPEAGTDLLGALLMQHAPPEEVKGGTGNELLDAVVGNSIYGSPPQAGPGPDETPPQRFPQPAAPPQTVQAQPLAQMAAEQAPQPQITPQQPIPAPQASALSRTLSALNPISSAQAAETAPTPPPPASAPPPLSGTGSHLLDGILKGVAAGVAPMAGPLGALATGAAIGQVRGETPQKPATPGQSPEGMLTGIGAVPSAKTDIEQAQIEQQQAQQPPASIPQRIAELGSAVLPYVAGGAPPGSLSAGLRFGRGAAQPRFEPPPLQDVDLGRPPPAAAAPTAAASPAPAPASAGSKFWNTVKETASKAREDLQIKTTPMAAGPERGVRVAKEFANQERLARLNRMHFDKLLRRFTPQQWNEMWEAMDRASVTAQVTGNLDAGFRHIAILPKEMRDVIVELEKFGIDLWQKARDAGIVAEDAERLPFYVTRGIVKIGEDGNFQRIGSAAGAPRNINPVGGNVRTQGVQSRQHLTVEQTQAAARSRFGEDAQVVRDIRALPWAYERLERAVAGRTLVNELKGMAPTGKELVADEWRKGFFNIDHPALKTYRPRFSNGKPVLDQQGNIIFDPKPIYISEEMRGPLTAVLRNTPGGVTNTLYQGTMMAKAGATSLIMNSFMIHNMVEWGRAMPAMPGKVAFFRIYGIGANTLKDMDLMRKAVGEDGLVPIGRGYQQDITGIAEATPGMGERKGMFSSLAGVLSPKASEAIDKAGQFWHEKLLWDQVAKLQAGLYSEMRSSLIGKGIDASTAGKIAAHMANRYAGALPNEAMSEGAKRLLNLTLFSRSFTMGNLGVMKDMLNGLPADVRAIIGRNLTPVEKAAAQSLARRKAIGIFMKDIALFYFGVAIFEHVLDLMKGDKSLGDIGQEYVDRYKRLVAKAKEHPLDIINPFNDAVALLPQSEHEPGKEARVPLFTQPDGTIIYGRLPTGKVGEEFQAWPTSTAPMIRNKLGTLARPLFNLLANDNGLGQKIWNPDAKGISGVAHNIGNIVWEIIRTQVPEMQLEGMIDIIQGKGGKLPYAQVALPFAGLTVSKGAPGGPAVGEMMRERREAEARIKDALPNVRRLVEDGRIEDAQKRLQDVGASPRVIKGIIGVYADPQRRLSRGRMKEFFRGATPEEADRMRRLLNIPAPAPQ